jgi:3-hydroxyacyl-[acyl-carrier-protein] dehydratase
MLSPLPSVRDLLPHRHPFLFVDQILSVKSGQSAQGLYRISGSHPFVNREADIPVFPSLLVIEALAQIAAVYIGLEQSPDVAESRPKGYLVRIDQCSFDSAVEVEETLVLNAHFVVRYGSLFKFNTLGEASGRTVARASLTLYLEP